ncbi:MAG: DUF3592 domain-containing protein [Actinomycetota bacterium]
MTAVRHHPAPPIRTGDDPGLRLQCNAFFAAAGLMIAPALVVTVMGLSQWQAMAELDRNGVVAPAEVVGASSWQVSDRVRVAFATEEGRLVEASLPVDDLEDHWRGATVLVRYDPQNPSRARPLEGWNPEYRVLFLIAATLLVIGAAFVVQAWRWPRRLLRVAASPGPRQSMLLTGAMVPGQVPSPWAVLSSAGAARHAFRLADNGDLPTGPVEVRVIGDVRRLGIVVVDTPDRRIWPASRLRRPPKRTLPAHPLPLPGPVPGASEDAVPEWRQRGDIPALPPDLAERLRQKERTCRPSPARFLVLLPVSVMVAAPALVPAAVEARRHICVAPPSTVGTADQAVVPELALPDFLPQVAGFAPVPAELLGLGAYDDPVGPVLLEDAGFLYGAQRVFVGDGSQVAVQVLQFSSERGPLHFEALRMTTWCVERPRAVAVPAGSGARGSVVSTEGGPDRTRFAFVRGSRGYLVHITGVSPYLHHDIVRSALATAG